MKPDAKLSRLTLGFFEKGCNGAALGVCKEFGDFVDWYLANEPGGKVNS